MPLLQFRCMEGHITDRLFSKMSESATVETTICSTCQLIARRILSRTANPQFVGPGFYQNDYARKA